jgi:hypothetical protein
MCDDAFLFKQTCPLVEQLFLKLSLIGGSVRISTGEQFVGILRDA